MSKFIQLVLAVLLSIFTVFPAFADDQVINAGTKCLGEITFIPDYAGDFRLDGPAGCGGNSHAVIIKNRSGYCYAPEITGLTNITIRKTEFVTGFGQQVVGYVAKTGPGIHDQVSCIPDGYDAYGVVEEEDFEALGDFYSNVAEPRELKLTLKKAQIAFYDVFEGWWRFVMSGRTVTTHGWDYKYAKRVGAMRNLENDYSFRPGESTRSPSGAVEITINYKHVPGR